MNVIIDVGNTRTKVAIFEDDNIVEIYHFQSNGFDLELILEKYKESPIILSTVRNAEIDTVSLGKCLLFNEHTLLPIKNNYRSETLGMDRLASSVGAFELFPAVNCLVIDLGSAITIDFLSEQGSFEGGNISLGMGLRFKALHNYTSGLPLVDHQNEIYLTSKNTEDAICSGVVKSIIFELEAYIEEYQKKFPNINIILTGGDSKFFAKQLKKRIFANENLVLIGLNRILNYNVEKL